MSAFKVASRYAKSLLDLAIEKDSLEAVYMDALLLKSAIKSSKDLYNLLHSPIIHADKKAVIISAIFKSKVNPLTFSFLEILIKKGREQYIDEMVAVFIEQYNVYRHITPVVIKTAVDVSPQTLQNILQKIKSDPGLKTAEVKHIVDPGLLGGFTVQYGDKMLDESIARKLNILTKEFTRNKYVKEIFK